MSYEAYQDFKKYTQIVEDGQEMLKEDDPEIKEMAQMEIDEAKTKLAKDILVKAIAFDSHAKIYAVTTTEALNEIEQAKVKETEEKQKKETTKQFKDKKNVKVK